jgi:hypothetical protein
MIIRTGTIMGAKLEDTMTNYGKGKKPAKRWVNATLQ